MGLNRNIDWYWIREERCCSQSVQLEGKQQKKTSLGWENNVREREERACIDGRHLWVTLWTGGRCSALAALLLYRHSASFCFVVIVFLFCFCFVSVLFRFCFCFVLLLHSVRPKNRQNLTAAEWRRIGFAGEFRTFIRVCGRVWDRMCVCVCVCVCKRGPTVPCV